jgi:hypothetical protein
MCGRARLSSDVSEIKVAFGISPDRPTPNFAANWIVVDEASERRQLVGRTMLGQRPDIAEHDVWQNIGENLSRQPIKASALASVQQQPRQGPRLSM